MVPGVCGFCPLCLQGAQSQLSGRTPTDTTGPFATLVSVQGCGCVSEGPAAPVPSALPVAAPLGA